MLQRNAGMPPIATLRSSSKRQKLFLLLNTEENLENKQNLSVIFCLPANENLFALIKTVLELVVVSAEEGVAKPDIEIFLRALK